MLNTLKDSIDALIPFVRSGDVAIFRDEEGNTSFMLRQGREGVADNLYAAQALMQFNNDLVKLQSDVISETYARNHSFGYGIENILPGTDFQLQQELAENVAGSVLAGSPKLLGVTVSSECAEFLDTLNKELFNPEHPHAQPSHNHLQLLVTSLNEDIRAAKVSVFRDSESGQVTFMVPQGRDGYALYGSASNTLRALYYEIKQQPGEPGEIEVIPIPEGFHKRAGIFAVNFTAPRAVMEKLFTAGLERELIPGYSAARER